MFEPHTTPIQLQLQPCVVRLSSFTDDASALPQARDAGRAELPIDDYNALLARFDPSLTSILRSHRGSHERAAKRHHFPRIRVYANRTPYI